MQIQIIEKFEREGMNHPRDRLKSLLILLLMLRLPSPELLAYVRKHPI